jgi:hypothetical protein
MLKTFFEKKISLEWKLGLSLILIFGVFRFIAVIYGIESGDNKYLSIIFISMMVLPYVILTEKGRKYVKIQKPKNLLSLFLSFLFGMMICMVIFLLGKALYGDALSNWFKYIGESYPIDFNAVSPADKKIYFYVFLGIGITFSPLGEELLYRGLVHGCFLKECGERKSSIIDSAAFGLTHLAHFGIIYNDDKWSIYFIPALIWVSLIFITGLIFNVCKSMSDSVLGAIVCHMTFNITMTYLIFYEIF